MQSSGVYSSLQQQTDYKLALQAMPSEHADESKQGAERDLRRAWRNVAFVQYYDPDAQIGDEAPAGEPALVTPLPAGCVRIDSALGELPPDIFGQALVVDIPARMRGGRRARGGRAAPMLPRQRPRRRREALAHVSGRRVGALKRAAIAGCNPRPGPACTPSMRSDVRYARLTTRTWTTSWRGEEGSGRTWRMRRVSAPRWTARRRGACCWTRAEGETKGGSGGRQGLGGLQASPPGVGTLTFLALGIPADAYGGSRDPT